MIKKATIHYKKEIENNNNDISTSTNNKTKEIEKLLDTAEEYFLSGQYKEATTYIDMVLAIDGNNTQMY